MKVYWVEATQKGPQMREVEVVDGAQRVIPLVGRVGTLPHNARTLSWATEEVSYTPLLAAQRYFNKAVAYRERLERKVDQAQDLVTEAFRLTLEVENEVGP